MKQRNDIVQIMYKNFFYDFNTKYSKYDSPIVSQVLLYRFNLIQKSGHLTHLVLKLGAKTVWLSNLCFRRRDRIQSS